MCPSFCWRGQLALFLEARLKHKEGCTVLIRREKKKTKKKNWRDLNTNSYFSQLPVWGSYNNEPYAGPKFLQTLQQNGQHKQTFPPAPVPAPQNHTAPRGSGKQTGASKDLQDEWTHPCPPRCQVILGATGCTSSTHLTPKCKLILVFARLRQCFKR